jgi:hypothetical protein
MLVTPCGDQIFRIHLQAIFEKQLEIIHKCYECKFSKWCVIELGVYATTLGNKFATSEIKWKKFTQ